MKFEQKNELLWFIRWLDTRIVNTIVKSLVIRLLHWLPTFRCWFDNLKPKILTLKKKKIWTIFTLQNQNVEKKLKCLTTNATQGWKSMAMDKSKRKHTAIRTRRKWKKIGPRLPHSGSLHVYWLPHSQHSISASINVRLNPPPPT